MASSGDPWEPELEDMAGEFPLDKLLDRFGMAETFELFETFDALDACERLDIFEMELDSAAVVHGWARGAGGAGGFRSRMVMEGPSEGEGRTIPNRWFRSSIMALSMVCC